MSVSRRSLELHGARRMSLRIYLGGLTLAIRDDIVETVKLASSGELHQLVVPEGELLGPWITPFVAVEIAVRLKVETGYVKGRVGDRLFPPSFRPLRVFVVLEAVESVLPCVCGRNVSAACNSILRPTISVAGAYSLRRLLKGRIPTKSCYERNRIEMSPS